jgi:hypothetical protein
MYVKNKKYLTLKPFENPTAINIPNGCKLILRGSSLKY